MKTGMLLCLLALVAASAQDKHGFTKSPTEHIINKLNQPFAVQSVSGVVTRGEGNQEPLRDAVVEIKGPGKQERLRRTKTDDLGQFRINHVPVGTYIFKVTLSGYQSVIGTVIVSKKAARGSSIKIAMLIGV
jgi:hypothetical protein